MSAVVVSEAAVARERTTTAALTLRTLLTSSAIFLVAGLLGGALRQSQAGIETLAVPVPAAGITGFALMGASWWVLEESGFPLRGPGLALAETCYWTMVTGVAGVVATTLAMGFGGSWVFLYPLPFYGAAQWTELTSPSRTR